MEAVYKNITDKAVKAIGSVTIEASDLPHPPRNEACVV